MNERLVEEGWVAPERPGPSRRETIKLVAFGSLLLLAWGLGGTGWLRDQASPSSPRTVDVAVGQDGAITVDGAPVDAEQRRRDAAAVTFLVARAQLDDDARGRRIRTRIEPGPGIDAEAIAVRVLQPTHDAERAELLVTVPLDALVEPPAADPDAPALRDATERFDARVRDSRADRRRLRALQDAWWWIAPSALLAAVVLPLVGWRRARSRRFSMRVPGPGAELDIAPPSSLDPVGAAVLVAGARPVDEASAFAGHVLDLVERRQLPLRRSTTTPPGLGTLVGLHHADELDDVAVPLLRELVELDGTTVVLPDASHAVRRLPAHARATWHEHVRARTAFERVFERPDDRLVAIGAAAAGAGALASTAAWLLAGADGMRATLLLAAVTLLSLAATLGACMRDVRRWRVVARSRRTERAQWIAWRELAGRRDGPTVDQRNLPVLVAIAAPATGASAVAGPAAVDLAAVTPRTIAALRATFDPD